MTDVRRTARCYVPRRARRQDACREETVHVGVSAAATAGGLRIAVVSCSYWGSKQVRARTLPTESTRAYGSMASIQLAVLHPTKRPELSLRRWLLLLPLAGRTTSSSGPRATSGAASAPGMPKWYSSGVEFS